MGVLLLVIGLGALIFGFTQHLKGKRILAAPFKKTGDIARDPTTSDPKGAISTEGAVIPPQTPMLSACSKTPCLYWEVKIERMYEKTETTQDGTKTVTGSDTLDTLKGGALAGLDDGTGAIAVDFSKGADFDNLKAGFKKELNGRGWSSNIQFGELQYDIPVLSSKEGYTIGFKATEKFVPVEGNLFVLGKIEGGKIVKPGWRSMMASSKGRDGLLASTAKKKKFSFIGGGIGAVAAIPLMIFGPKADPAADHSCHHELAAVQSKCDANMNSTTGNDYAWNITAEGEYSVVATPPRGKKYPFDPQILIKSASGDVVSNESAVAPGEPAKATVNLKPGAYTVTVRELGGGTVKGGWDYTLETTSSVPQAVAKADGTKDDAAPAAEGAAEQTGPIALDAPKLAAEMMTGQAAYDGKTLEVKGIAERVQTNPDNTIVIFKVPTNPNGGENEVAAFLPAKAKVKKGQVVTVRGVAAGDNTGYSLTNAELVTGKTVAQAKPAKGSKKVQPRNGKH
jgi:hypothetical protein